MTCINCGKERPHANIKYCGRSCQGKVQGKTANFNHSIATQWTNEEIDILKHGYGCNISAATIALQLNRPMSGVYCKANSLYITDARKPKREEQLEKLSQRMKQWWAVCDEKTKQRIVSHPCVEATRKKISIAVKNSERHKIAMQFPERRQRLSNSMVFRHINGAFKGGYSNGKQGQRADLNNLYLRSSWEANYARYLNLLCAAGKINSWEYEARRFEFKEIKRGTRSYLPDFKVVLPDGRIEWHEVKGWMTSKGKTAITRFKKYYPDEIFILIDKEKYYAIKGLFKDKIPGWE